MTSKVQIRLQVLNIIAALALLLFISLLIGKEPDRLQQAQRFHTGKQIEIGASVYSENCQSCHGSRGEGMGQLGPALNAEEFFITRLSEVGWLASLESYIYSTTEHGRMMGTREFYAGNGSTSVMPPWHERYGGPLRSDQVEAVTAFVLNWKATATKKITLQKVDYVVPKFSSHTGGAGKHVFKKHCVKCHVNKDFTSSRIKGPDLSDISISVERQGKNMKVDEYIKESVLLPNKYLVEGFQGLRREHGCGAILSESELDTLVDYLM